MQPHHVVDAEEAGMFHVMPQRPDQVLVTGVARRRRVGRREGPVLSERHEAVRWRARRAAFHELRSEAPRIIAVGVHAEGQVQVELHAFPAQLIAQLG